MTGPNGPAGRRGFRLAARAWLLQAKARRHLPPVARGLAGLALVGLGLLGFLPVLGFWMIPLGLVLLATDIPPLGRWVRRRLRRMRGRRG